MSNVDVPMWLRELPEAPEFRPTDTEFADPIAYISKIEKESSFFGICKIIPPMPKPSKRYVMHNLNKSLSKCPELGEDVNMVKGNVEETRAVFTTRQQELGFVSKKLKGDNLQSSFRRQVWQSGEVYTLEQFESKSKAFAKNMLGVVKDVNPLVVESLFWKAASEKPIYVEYANDVPGSGFSEPMGHFFHSGRRAKRRKSYKSYRRDQENSTSTRVDSDEQSGPQSHEVEFGNLGCDVNLVDVEQRQSSNYLSLPSEETLINKRSTSLDVNTEGSSGWKLSNSPWNIQVIARSPGSLTRYMPDDIPGVTSPMVYIGMLFSWFAWHVEDHELHSLNFLHTGSSKTWYAVPGEHSHKFEDVIRTKAYGDNVDRVAALRMLGEKTTLLSPEVVVASGIPCCRLVQNPGEFVVTFPSAYHIGFSHGFNCGEAANFGTPRWLQVAKEAAVRRASMNYLPMLSHQQLMYLLTMSFVSRVPRSLLPGVRCSRHRDRLREDRELSVKKAFIKDVVEDNQLLSVLLKRNSAYHAVLWNAELLPYIARDNSPLITNGSDDTVPSQEFSDKNVAVGEKRDLAQEMEIYLENLNSLYMDNDDLSNDFQVDSGTLECVACGILGFPFMCVIQPSRLDSIVDPSNQLPAEETEDSKTENNHEDSNDSTFFPHHSLPDRWVSSGKFLRPRLFCLEHGIQVEELLTSKGGANLLITCHSDFMKIKAHASVIAEEVCSSYHDVEVPLNTASQEELNLISSAIQGENPLDCGEDWTSALKINLHHCLKMRKLSPSKQHHLAIPLGNLFSEDHTTTSPSVKWHSRRSRSKIKSEQTPVTQQIVNCEEKKLIQYYRRKFKQVNDETNLVSESRDLGSEREAEDNVHSSASSLKENEVMKKRKKIGLDQWDISNSFIRGPCEGLRPRTTKQNKTNCFQEPSPIILKPKDLSFQCDIEGCNMRFNTSSELGLHKQNQCPYEGCGKEFSSHKYAMIHQRVHEDERPLRCSWKGCSMAFKWAWARTEHLRVHTGERPYECKADGCGRSFRFVSDFSRHRRKTGHNLETSTS